MSYFPTPCRVIHMIRVSRACDTVSRELGYPSEVVNESTLRCDDHSM
jgi:hypothetical protein